MNKKIIILMFGLLPTFSWASTFADFVNKINNSFIPPLFSLLIIMATVFFALNVLIFIFSEGDKKQKFKDRVVWSVIALVVLMSMWGIVAILQNTAPSLNKGQKNFDFKSNYQYYIK